MKWGKKAASHFFIVGVVSFSITWFLYLTRPAIDSLKTLDTEVVESKIEEFEATTGRWWSSQSNYYEFAIYNQNDRFFIRNPERAYFKGWLNFIEPNKTISILYLPKLEGNGGYRLSLIHI